MKYYIISGEASGDLHGSNLIKEIKKIDIDASFRCWGGDLMKEQGGDIVKHYKDLAFMGFFEVLMKIRTILNNIKWCKKDITEHQPDAVILIDYPGFNLRIADFLKDKNIPVLYYISPQVWAWKKSRVLKIKRNVDRMFVILPFEKEFYKNENMEVTFVGHPLIDAIEEFKNNKASSSNEFKNNYQLDERPIISILPGSRRQELSLNLPVMLNALSNFDKYQVVIACAPSINIEYYQSMIIDHPNVKLIKNDTYNLLNQSFAAIVTSGTATLETALFNVPQVVCYKSSWISYQIAKKLIKVKFISLVNLILDKECVKELIQNDLNEKKLNLEVEKILKVTNRDKIIKDYLELKNICGGVGASKITANEMLKTIQTEHPGI